MEPPKRSKRPAGPGIEFLPFPAASGLLPVGKCLRLIKLSDSCIAFPLADIETALDVNNLRRYIREWLTERQHGTVAGHRGTFVSVSGLQSILTHSRSRATAALRDFVQLHPLQNRPVEEFTDFAAAADEGSVMDDTDIASRPTKSARPSIELANTFLPQEVSEMVNTSKELLDAAKPVLDKLRLNDLEKVVPPFSLFALVGHSHY